MKPIQALNLWWQKQTGEEDVPLDRDSASWVVSMLLHLGVIVGLGLLTMLPENEDEILVVADREVPKLEALEELPTEVSFSDQLDPKIGANSVNGENAAAAQAIEAAEVSEAPTLEVVVDKGNPIFETFQNVSLGPIVNAANKMVRGTATGIGATGALGAVDRITQEIILSLEQRKTLVVWVFDQSGSLQRQREAVRDRFARIYEELGVLEEAGSEAFKKHDDKPLLTSVVAFGKSYNLLLKEPTDDLEKIQEAIGSIQNDSSGVENVFGTVGKVAHDFRFHRTKEPRRNVMIVVFTDEAGDDAVQFLDPAVAECRKYQMPVYVVGVPAPFSRDNVEIKYVDPDPQYDQAPQWIPVRQGPESFFPEGVKIRFTRDRGMDGPEPAIDSGFGPYALTRLCLETGGTFFAVHPNRNDGKSKVNRRETAELSAHFEHFFDPEKMRPYRPDYVSAAEYDKLLKQNKAKLALVEASRLSWADALGDVDTHFPKVSEADLANALSAAQQQAAKVEPKLDRIHQTLLLGEKDRAKIKELRWQAGYDLAMGRTLATMVRAKGYNTMLAMAKQGMKFKNEKNDTWDLKPSEAISSGSVIQKQAEQALVYLNRVVEEHPGTPWALLAQRELDQPLGWEWVEDYTGVSAPRMAQGGDGGVPAAPANEKEKKMTKPKEVRRPNL